MTERMNTGIAHPETTDVATLHRQAVDLLNRRQIGAAQQCCLRIIREEPQHADAHFLLGMISIEVGRPNNALGFIDKAIGYIPDRAEYHAHRGRCLALLNRNRESLQAADRALALNPRDALTCDTIGVVCSQAADHERAARAFRLAVERSPDTPGYRFNLGAALKFLGRFDEAEVAFEAAIARSPKFYKAHASLSQLRTQTPEKNHIKRLEGLVRHCGDNVAAEVQLRQALAKEYEDLGDYDEAFKNLTTGKSRRKRTLGYSFERDRALFAELERQFADGSPPENGCPNAEPIFVVGMPRTGTTLVERILTSHSGVFAAGELSDFAIALKRAAGTRTPDMLDPETLQRAMQADFGALGQAYLDGTRPRTGHTPHFVDKMPVNFMYIGFIRYALPNARIICLRRNPLDTCLSNFRQFFDPRFGFYNYSYDLLDTGRYYVLFDRLMRHWQRIFPGRILEVEYEAVVADQERQSRRIVEYCGLDWEDACLAFDRNAAPVATASSVQVRQPLYKHAAGRWQRYEKHLGDLQRLLESEGVELDVD